MVIARATLGDRRIELRTRHSYEEFDEVLAACKAVGGGRFHKDDGDKFWHYPLSIDTCHQLRRAFGNWLLVSNELAEWYRREAKLAADHKALAGESDATLERVSPQFSAWLHGYQRAGARWIAKGYRGAGLVADKPGVGKTPETLAGLIEMGLQGPVLVVCPKSSVRLVWGLEMRRHLPDVPVYLCYGNRERRSKVLKQFSNDVHRKPDVLRVVVIVAEMLRVELGDPCYTVQEVIGEDGIRQENVPKNKISGMCPQRLKNMNMECTIHVQVKAEKKKDLVPVDFSYPILFDKWNLGGGWATVILDESHKLLGSLTIVKSNLMGRGLKLLPYRSAARRYALSGTPFGKGGRVEGMFGTLHWLWPDEYTSYWRWAYSVFDIEETVIGFDRFTQTQKTAKKIRGLKGVGRKASAAEEAEAWENFLRTLGPRILRRTKEETLTNLPPKAHFEIVCEMDPRQRRQYNELVEWAEFKTPNGVVTANGALALLTRSRQLANGELTKGPDDKVQFTGNSGKIDRLLEGLDHRGILEGLPGDKIVVASAYNEFLDAVSDVLYDEGVPHLRFDGRTPGGRRNTIVNLWQSGEVVPNRSVFDTAAGTVPRVLMINTKAGGVSITLDAADEMHILDEDPDPGVNEQLEDRIHRASRVHRVRIFYYRTEGTIDYKRAHDVEYRRQMQHAVLDGSRGMVYARKMLAEAFLEKEE